MRNKWAGSAAGGLAVAVAGYAVLRALGVVLLAIFAEPQGVSWWQPLLGYDAKWYLSIATGGYDGTLPLKPNGALAPSNLAFFPLYPGLIVALDPVLPGGVDTAGIVVSWLSGLAAAAGLYAVGVRVRDRRTGIVLAALWAVVPHGIVQTMAYTEGLFTALAAWSLYAVLSRRWLLAGGLCLVAGLARPTAAALVVAVGLACLVAAVRRQDGWRPWAAGLLAPLGFLGYLAWVGQRLGRADGYFYVQDEAWGSAIDGGRDTVATAWRVLTNDFDLAYYVVTAVIVVALALFGLAVADRVPWPLLVYAAVVLAVTLLGAGYYHSKARLLMPAFPLLLPIALPLAGARVPRRVAVLGLLGIGSGWYGTYLCLVWQYSP